MKWHEDSSRYNLPGNDHLVWKLRWLSLGTSQPLMRQYCVAVKSVGFST